jgi:hypothetical protein
MVLCTVLLICSFLLLETAKTYPFSCYDLLLCIKLQRIVLCIFFEYRSLSSIPKVELLSQDGTMFSFIDIVNLFAKLVTLVCTYSRSITDFQLLHIIDKTWDCPSLLFSFNIKYLLGAYNVPLYNNNKHTSIN